MARYNGQVNLKEWAESRGVAYVTARRWYAPGPRPQGWRPDSGRRRRDTAGAIWCDGGVRPGVVR
ncbi:hypothetical protein FRACA_40012 [Frankia canadensis]|uniref:Uncharacterized protein n=1 Tax=Frankia canadensis TaxID=1836972 RepID=A0A2I2KWF3_9ACTN|nr:hypothetical protein FRACA_40012 [Frankia canadensis]SOU57274.1 hypothetical protein FRACA_40012 [Frankia canadensis]